MAARLQSIAGSFRRLGWLGFWVQLLIGLLPVAMLLYVVLGKVTGNRAAFSFTNYLAMLGMAILLFTAFWLYGYTRVAKRMIDPARRPSWASVLRTLWIGLWAGMAGVFVVVVSLFIEVSRLLFLFMKTPQGGVPVMRTETESRADWVSAIDIVFLLADLCTLVGELLVLAITIWLLFRIVMSGDAFGHAAASHGETPA